MSGSHQRSSPYDHRDRATRQAFGSQIHGEAWNEKESFLEPSDYREKQNPSRCNTTKKRTVTYIGNQNSNINHSTLSNDIYSKLSEKHSHSHEELDKHSTPHELRSKRIDTSKLKLQAGGSGDKNKQKPYGINKNGRIEDGRTKESHSHNEHPMPERCVYPQRTTRAPTNQWEAYRQINDQRMGRLNNREKGVHKYSLVDEDCEEEPDSAFSETPKDQHNVKQAYEDLVQVVTTKDLLRVNETERPDNQLVTEDDIHRVRYNGNAPSSSPTSSSGYYDDEKVKDLHQQEQINQSSEIRFDGQIITGKENAEHPDQQMNHTTERCYKEKLQTDSRKHKTQPIARGGKPDRSLKPNMIFQKLKSPDRTSEQKQSFDSNEQALRYLKLYDQKGQQSFPDRNDIFLPNPRENGTYEANYQWRDELQRRQIERLKESLGIKIPITPNYSNIPEDEIINNLNDSYEEYKETCRKHNLRTGQVYVIKESNESQKYETLDDQGSAISTCQTYSEHDEIENDCNFENDNITEPLRLDDHHLCEKNESCGFISSIIGEKPTRRMEVTTSDNKISPDESPRTIERIVSFVHNSIKSFTPIEKQTAMYTRPLTPFQSPPTISQDTSGYTGKPPLESESLRCVHEFLRAQDSQQKFSFKSPSCERQTQTLNDRSLRRSVSRERHTQTVPVVALNVYGSNTNHSGPEHTKGLDNRLSPPPRSRSVRQKSPVSPVPPPAPHSSTKKQSQTQLAARHGGPRTSPPPSNTNVAASSRNPAASNSNTVRRKCYRKRSSSKSKTTFI